MLDYDGCLHSDNVYIHPTRGIYIRDPGHHLFEWEHILVELLAAHPEVGIVLSTSWVSRKSFSYAKKQLCSDLQSRVVGATFHNRETDRNQFAQLSRASQIFADVYRRGLREEDWIAIDDDAEGWPFMYARNLIRTDGALGISEPAVQTEIEAWLKRGQGSEQE